MVDTKNRCPTGIPGFDKLCSGGFVRNSTNVLLGGPGAGKTTFLLQFLYNGVIDYKENGLYISFEPEIEDLYKDAANFGWDFKKLDASGKCKIIKLSPKSGIVEIKEEIEKMINKKDIQRVCIDPVSLLAMNMEKERDVRELIFDLASTLKKLNVTTLLADETINEPGSISNAGINDADSAAIKFLSDSIIDLYSMGIGGTSDRALRIEKMRRTSHVRGPVAFQMNDKGIKVLDK
jgi:circadian clock protein KaiC